MIVRVSEHYTGRERVFDGGPDEVRKSLLHYYHWLLVKFGPHAEVDLLVRALDKAQAYSAAIQGVHAEPEGEDLHLHFAKSERGPHPMFGVDAELTAMLRAAAFLSGATPDVATARRAMIATDGDPARAALLAVGLEPGEANLTALRAVAGLPLRKAQGEPVRFQEVLAVVPSGESVAQEVLRASAAGTVEAVDLPGAHAAGMLLAEDPQTNRKWLLKPGANAQDPAAGDRESAASQAKREAAWYAVVSTWGLADRYPACHLLQCDQTEYAAVHMLPWDFKTLNSVRREDPGLPARLFQLYLTTGELHKWATADLVLGNVDSHAGNLLIRGSDVYLIDHGSAFAGTDFNPRNGETFLPAYLRALAPADLSSRGPAAQLQALPRVAPSVAGLLAAWINGLDRAELGRICSRYGIEAEPSQIRLDKLRDALDSMAADLAVNAMWTL